jgi:signal transduction histidine kinase
MGLNEHQLPTDDDLNKLLEVSAYPTTHLSWVRVTLQLKIGEQTQALWLLGRRDPDDFYATAEMATLQAIANQTAIALSNITKTKDLRALYQSSIDREESERTRLAHELHDTVLNQLAVLYGRIDILPQIGITKDVEETYRQLINTIRQLIKGLRPAMLSYGLRVALDDLVDNLDKRHPEDGPFWEIDFSTEDFRYEQTVEQHLFRIMEQACENVLRHAQAETIWVTSRFTPTRVELIVEDDGIGFEVGEVMDLTYLLTHQHFGLVGMWERARLIGALLRIESFPAGGTRISVTWEQ